MMRTTSLVPAVAAVASTAVLITAFIFLSPDSVRAEPQAPAAASSGPSTSPSNDLKPRWITPPSRSIPFDDYDQIAALDAVRIALSEVGDGATYVWHRRDGSFSGTAQPTQSFKNSDGQPCRHIVVTLQTAGYTRSTEGIACRLVTGRWQLDG